MNRKKELKMEYLQNFKEPGVLMIKNTINGKIFIYAAMDIKSKLNRFKLELKQNGNKVYFDLQKDVNQYGIENFTFDVLEIIEKREEPSFDYKSELEKVNRKWLGQYQPYGDKGYNKL